MCFALFTDEVICWYWTAGPPVLVKRPGITVILNTNILDSDSYLVHIIWAKGPIYKESYEFHKFFISFS